MRAYKIYSDTAFQTPSYASGYNEPAKNIIKLQTNDGESFSTIVVHIRDHLKRRAVRPHLWNEVSGQRHVSIVIDDYRGDSRWSAAAVGDGLTITNTAE